MINRNLLKIVPKSGAAVMVAFSLVLVSLNSMAAPGTMPARIWEGGFFNDTSRSIPAARKKTLINVNGDDSGNLNRMINDLSGKGGGIITIPSGTWQFGEIRLKSNIHLVINNNAVIKPKLSRLSNKSIFIMGHGGKIKNVSIRSSSASGKFKIDMSGISNGLRVFVFNVAAIENFRIQGVNVIDKQTVHSTVNLGVSKVGNRWTGAYKGLVKNLTVSNAHGGYGAVQVRVGKKILFKNINSTSGGATLRLESDAHSATGNQAPISLGISEVSAYNIGCRNGNSAVMVQPWGVKNGWFDVQKVTSNSCGAAVRIDRAFVDWRTPSGQFTNPNNKPVGNFDPTSRITDVNATYGTAAQVNPGTVPFVPCALRNKLSRGTTNNFHKGPAISPLLYAASSTTINDPRFYKIKVPSFWNLKSKSRGFPSASKIIARDNDKKFNCN